MAIAVRSTERQEDSKEPVKISAFVVDPDTEASIADALGRMEAPKHKVRKGGIKAAIEHFSTHSSTPVIIVDVSDVDMALSQIDELANVCEPGVSVIVLGKDNNIGLFRDLMRMGVTDYLVKPAPYEHLFRSVRVALGDDDPGRPATQRLGKAVAVSGARGGAGATTLLANVGWVLANKRSRRVALVDLDLQNGSLHLALDFPANHGLREALENAHRLDPLFLERTMLQHGPRLFALAAEEPLDEDIVYSPDAVKELTQILQRQFHYVFVDVPRGAPGALEIVRRADIRILVAEPSIASVRDIVRRLQAIGGADAGKRNYIVLNQPRQESKGELTVEQFEDGISHKVDFVVPYGKAVAAEALNFGEPLAARRCSTSAAFAAIAGEMIGDRPRTVPMLQRLLRRGKSGS